MLRPRYYAFDAARALMMLLGVLVHSILIVEVMRPLSTLDAFALLPIYSGIHLFRIPAFFLLAGFFAAMLYEKAGIRGFVVSRFKRLIAPFLAAELVIFVMFSTLGCQACTSMGSATFLGSGLLHLWFLYDLILISLVWVAVFWLVEHFLPKLRARFASLVGRVSRFMGAAESGMDVTALICLALLCSLPLGILDGSGELRSNLGFALDLPLLWVFTMFFGAGWFSFARRELVLRDLRDTTLVNGVFAALLATIHFQLFALFDKAIAPLTYMFASWFAVAFVLGAAQLLVTEPKRWVSYLSDAAYSVYLFHLGFVLAFAWAFTQLGWPNLLVVPAAALLAFAISLALYHWLVRGTILGRWLSGRRRGKLGEAELRAAGSVS